MKKQEKLYEGKAKIIYATEDPSLVIQYFKDEATAFNALKKGTINNKGILNNAISCQIFQNLSSHVPTHFVKKLSDREMLVKKVDIIPIEVVARNKTAGSLAKRMGIEEGESLPNPIIEYYYKRDDLGDPMLTRDHIRAFKLVSSLADLDYITIKASQINCLLKLWFEGIDVLLVDFKIEFGYHKGQILLADEISPDSCRLWDKNTYEKLDKDRFRRDLGRIEEAYQEIHRRILSTIKVADY